LLQLTFQDLLPEAGLDEAGRGSFAGPVFAAAVILPSGFHHPLLNDSKQVSAPNRYLLRDYIEKQALDFGVAQVNEDQIDRINILRASFLAMHQALDRLRIRPRFLLVDGNRFAKYRRTPHRCLVEGDAKFAAIAAASILAKTYRDDYMIKLHEQFPQYHWHRNKGYGTLEHRLAIRAFGLCKYHRKSFQIQADQLECF
jgi:ribonuclease HII